MGDSIPRQAGAQVTAPITDAELARLEPDEPSDPPAPVTDGDLARMLRKFSDLLNVDDAKRLAWSLREARRERDTAYAKGRADERADAIRYVGDAICRGDTSGVITGLTKGAHVTGAKGKGT